MSTTILLQNKAVVFDNNNSIETISLQVALEQYSKSRNKNTYFFASPYFNFLIHNLSTASNRIIKQYTENLFQSYKKNTRQHAEAYSVDNEKTIITFCQQTDEINQVPYLSTHKKKLQCFYPSVVKKLFHLRHQIKEPIICQIDNTALFFIPSLVEFYFFRDWSDDASLIDKKIELIAQNKYFHQYQIINVEKQNWIDFFGQYKHNQKRDFKVISIKDSPYQKQKDVIQFLVFILLIVGLLFIGLHFFDSKWHDQIQTKQFELKALKEKHQTLQQYYPNQLHGKLKDIFDELQDKQSNLWFSTVRADKELIFLHYFTLQKKGADRFLANLLDRLENYRLKTKKISETTLNGTTVYEHRTELIQSE